MSTPSDGTRFVGMYSGGRNATASWISVRFTGGGIDLNAEDPNEANTWPYDLLRSSVPLSEGSPDVLLSVAPDYAETLFVSDPSFARLLLARAPALGGSEARPRRTRRSRPDCRRHVAAEPASGPGGCTHPAAGGPHHDGQCRRAIDGEGQEGV